MSGSGAQQGTGEGAPAGAAAPARRWWRFAPLLALAAGLALLYAFDLDRFLSLDALYRSRLALKAFVDAHYLVSLAGALLLYALAIAFVFPAPVILTIAAGFLFGWLVGGCLAVLGATLGGTALFLAARTAFGSVLARRAGPTVARFADGFRREAFTYLLVLRLTPLLPVAALNIAPALFEVRLRAFVAATFLGVIPGAMVYAFLGKGLNRTLKLAGRDGSMSPSDLLTQETGIALVGLFALAVLGLVLKRRLAAAATGSAPAARP